MRDDALDGELFEAVWSIAQSGIPERAEDTLCFGYQALQCGAWVDGILIMDPRTTGNG